ncbi:MAG: DUF86 domain-containing protein [Parvibaculum sp.]|nr:DUF86 domain-containing protein [Parvibaculum sp.]
MNEHQALEEGILDKYEAQWRAQGYDLIRHPSREVIPEFLGKYRPDAVLVGRRPHVAVEVVLKGQRTAERRLREIAPLFKGHPDWRLEVIYAGLAPESLVAPPMSALNEAVHDIRALASVDTRGAFLFSWAVLEALVRHLSPERTRSPQTPGRLVELLAGDGRITPHQAEELRTLARLRNKLVHGDLEQRPTEKQISLVTRILERLIGEVAI